MRQGLCCAPKLYHKQGCMQAQSRTPPGLAHAYSRFGRFIYWRLERKRSVLCRLPLLDRFHQVVKCRVPAACRLEMSRTVRQGQQQSTSASRRPHQSMWNARTPHAPNTSCPIAAIKMLRRVTRLGIRCGCDIVRLLHNSRSRSNVPCW